MNSGVTIYCPEHGNTQAGIVCKHLHEGRCLRYHKTRPFPVVFPSLWEAVCTDCNAILEREKGWTDRVEEVSKLSSVCTTSFRRMLKNHTRVRKTSAVRKQTSKQEGMSKTTSDVTGRPSRESVDLRLGQFFRLREHQC